MGMNVCYRLFGQFLLRICSVFSEVWVCWLNSVGMMVQGNVCLCDWLIIVRVLIICFSFFIVRNLVCIGIIRCWLVVRVLIISMLSSGGLLMIVWLKFCQSCVRFFEIIRLRLFLFGDWCFRVVSVVFDGSREMCLLLVLCSSEVGSFLGMLFWCRNRLKVLCLRVFGLQLKQLVIELWGFRLIMIMCLLVFVNRLVRVMDEVVLLIFFF